MRVSKPSVVRRTCGVCSQSNPGQSVQTEQRGRAPPRFRHRIVRSSPATIRLATMRPLWRMHETLYHCSGPSEPRLRLGPDEGPIRGVPRLALAAVFFGRGARANGFARRRARGRSEVWGGANSAAAARRRVETSQCSMPRNGFGEADMQVGRSRCTTGSGDHLGPQPGSRRVTGREKRVNLLSRQAGRARRHFE